MLLFLRRYWKRSGRESEVVSERLLELIRSFLMVNSASMIQAIKSKTQWTEPTKELMTSRRISFVQKYT